MKTYSISDIIGDSCLTSYEDAACLLLISIALEEISLSELIKSESKKIDFIVEEAKQCRASIEDIKEINKSVDQIMKDIIKFQMLLQFKLENVIELLCTKTCTSTTSSTTTHTTTTTFTTTSTTSTRTTTTNKNKCKCSLTGRAHGCVSNVCDHFYGGLSVLHACICIDCCDIEASSMCYSVSSGDTMLCFILFPESLEIMCPSVENPDRIFVKGSGFIKKTLSSRQEITGVGNFTLTVWNKGQKHSSYEMIICNADKLELNHNSGIIHTKDSTLDIRNCPHMHTYNSFEGSIRS